MVISNSLRFAHFSSIEPVPLSPPFPHPRPPFPHPVLLQQLEQRGSFDWTMPPAEALYCFTKWVDKKVAASPRWPKTPTALGKEVRLLAPLLREHGLFVTFGKNRESRLITFTAKPGSECSSATP
jgi:hypothetical protein